MQETTETTETTTPEQEENYFGMISELTSIKVKGFPQKFPMFFLCTTAEIDAYNKLMIKAIAKGFDPKVRKLCFTLGCSEGFKHDDIYNIAKELPVIDKEKYDMLKTIVHWNPILEGTLVLRRYVELVEAAEGEHEDFLLRAFSDVEDNSDIRPKTD